MRLYCDIPGAFSFSTIFYTFVQQSWLVNIQKMSDFNLTDWLTSSFQILSQQKWNIRKDGKPFFDAIWYPKLNIKFEGDTEVFDTVDMYSAMLVCKCVYSADTILLILPDAHPHRPASLFANALLMSSVDSLVNQKDGGRVLYFGTTLSIRNQLSRISIGSLSLSSVFSDEKIYHIPKVECIYSPLDPIACFQTQTPRWIAVDCGEASSVQWIEPLLEYSQEKNIPLIAWSSNPLSPIRASFEEKKANIFTWPLLSLTYDFPNQNIGSPEVLRIFTQAQKITKITPCLINSSTTDTFSEYFQNTQRALIRGIRRNTGRLGKDAMSIAWQYLRALERIPIPVDIFDAESIHYWGIKPISRLKTALEKFLSNSYVESSALGEHLEEAYANLSYLYDQFLENSPPLWNTLVELCIEDIPEGDARLIVFPNKAYRSMFVYSLLALTKTSEDDLKQMRVWLLSFQDASSKLHLKNDRTPIDTEGEIGSDIPVDLNWNIIHAALPNKILSERMAPFFSLDSFEVLVYPHQLYKLSYQTRKWGEVLGVDLAQTASTISRITSLSLLESEVLAKRKSVAILGESRTVTGHSFPGKTIRQLNSIWRPTSEEEEVAYLFGPNDDDRIDESLPDEEIDEYQKDDPLVERALEVKFSGGWKGLFDFDTKINVIHQMDQGAIVQNSYVKSLRETDTIIYIHGQKRQSLYDLVISRVHNHPSISIHVALIQQWQNEIRHRYSIWCKNGKTIRQLYQEMVVRGTGLDTEMALRFWIAGSTLRPHDPDDLRRIAEVLEMPFTLKHYKRIHLAGGRIHGLHISLSQRLNKWIQSGVASSEMADDIIDEDTGLTFSDIRDSIILLRVESATEVDGPLDRASLGKIERS